MYSRNFKAQGKTPSDSEIPDNYSGVALREENSEKTGENVNNSSHFQPADAQPTMSCSHNEKPCEKNEEKAENKECKNILSGLFKKIGINGAESSDITILIIAILLLSGEDDDYIWLLLLLLLIIN